MYYLRVLKGIFNLIMDVNLSGPLQVKHVLIVCHSITEHFILIYCGLIIIIEGLI